MRVCLNAVTVRLGASIVDAIKVIDAGRLQAVLILDGEGILKGIITDGDVRRGLLRGVDLNAPVSEIMNQHPVVVSENEPREAALSRLRKLGTKHLPVVDECGKLLALEVVQFAEFDLGAPEVAVLMAGGVGKRLLPITESIPKPLVLVGDCPILEIIIRNLLEQGIRRFYISVNYKADMIEDYFGTGEKWGIQISYLREQKKLGTAGALGLISERPQMPFLVMNGDIVTSVNLRQLFDYHDSMGAMATVGAFAHEYQIPYGVLEMEDGRVTGIHEKPIVRKYVSGGVYALSPPVLEFVHANEQLDMPNLIERLVGGGMRVTAFPIREYWIDIGRHGDLKRACDDIRSVFPIRNNDASISRGEPSAQLSKKSK